MNEPKKYIDETGTCTNCARRGVPCLWEVTTPFRGIWLCAECRHELSETLADLVKARAEFDRRHKAAERQTA